MNGSYPSKIYGRILRKIRESDFGWKLFSKGGVLNDVYFVKR